MPFKLNSYALLLLHQRRHLAFYSHGTHLEQLTVQYTSVSYALDELGINISCVNLPNLASGF
jgi:hypothetical protein